MLITRSGAMKWKLSVHTTYIGPVWDNFRRVPLELIWRMAPNGLILKQLMVDTISMKASFSLQRGIRWLDGFRKTHRVTSGRAHTIPSYLPAFAIALPPHECSWTSPALLFSNSAQKWKAEKRLGFHPALQRRRRRRRSDLQRWWKPPLHALRQAPSHTRRRRGSSSLGPGIVALRAVFTRTQFPRAVGSLLSASSKVCTPSSSLHLRLLYR
jgi:hypothetical protein